MNDCKPYTTSVDTHANVSFDIGASFNDPTTHHNLDEAFQYLTFTRLAISYAVQQVCLHIHDPHGPISLLRSTSSATSRAPLTTTCLFITPLHLSLSSTLTLNGRVVPILASPLRTTRFSYATTSSTPELII
jgi:hypothetical protein